MIKIMMIKIMTIDKDNKKYEDKNESQPKKKKKFVLYFNYLVLFVLEINIYIFID